MQTAQTGGTLCALQLQRGLAVFYEKAATAPDTQLWWLTIDFGMPASNGTTHDANVRIEYTEKLMRRFASRFRSYVAKNSPLSHTQAKRLIGGLGTVEKPYQGTHAHIVLHMPACVQEATVQAALKEAADKCHNGKRPWNIQIKIVTHTNQSYNNLAAYQTKEAFLEAEHWQHCESRTFPF